VPRVRVVADAMILAAGFAFRNPGSASSRFIQEWLDGEFELRVSGKLVGEVVKTLDQLGLERPDVQGVVDVLCFDAMAIVTLRHLRMGCSDPDDDHLLEAAVSSRAQFIVSEDRALLNLRTHVLRYLRARGVSVVPLGRFFDALDAVRRQPPFSCLIPWAA